MLDRIKHALGMPTEEEKRQLREQTPGTPEYYAAIDAAIHAARYEPDRHRALVCGLFSAAHPLSVYHNIGGWQVQEWPYDHASVPLAEWRPSERFLAHMAAEGQG